MASTEMTSKVVVFLILSYISRITYGKCVTASFREDEFCQVENEDPMKFRSSNQTITLSLTPGLNFHPQPSDIDNVVCLLPSNMTNSLPKVHLVKKPINAKISSINNSLPNNFDNFILLQTYGNSSSLISGVQHQRNKPLTAAVANRAKMHKHHVVKRKSRHHHNHHSRIHHKKHHHHHAHGDQKIVTM